MHQLTSRGWFSRLAPATALGFAFLFALGSQLHAQATLIVSYYGYTPHTNGMGGINFYATNPPYTAGAQVGTTLAQGTFPQLEASSCLAGPTPKLFTSSNSNTISTYNLNSALNGVTGTATTFVNSLFSVAGLSIGPNGLLYAADGVGIYAFAITTGKQVASFPLSGAHDVVYAPLARGGLGIVFATSSYNSATVYALDPISLARLGSGYDITLPPGPTFAQEGLAVDPGGNLFISNFQTIDHTQPGVYMYPGALNTSTPIEFFSDLFHHPLGLAAGPGDGKIYVANFGNLTNADLGGVLQIDPLNPLNPPVPLALTMSPMLANPKYVQFTENCTQPAPNGTIEICKLSSPLNPVPPGGVYNFNVMGVAATVTVPLGECSGPIYVPPPSAVITELPTPGTAVYTITTDGYSPPPFSQQQGNALLESSNTQTGMATVIVQGGLETIVTYTNYEAPNAQLKVCKIAGDTGTEGKSFTFTVTPPVGAAPFTVEAGPMGEGGYCTVVPSTFQVGTFATVTETLPVMPLIYSQPTVTVNGVPTKPRCSGVTSVTCSVAAAIGAGTNEVDFTNQLASSMPGPGCPPSCFGTPTTTLLTASDPAPVLGSPVTFAAVVTPGAGVVSFLDGTTLLGTATLNASGLAIYSTSTLALGAHSITASYAGNDAYGPSTSNTVVVVVTQPSSQALLTAVPNPLVVSAPATVGTATLQWSAPAATTVELHVTSPDGPLLAGGGSSGSASTGTWVSDGMLFYLQDTTG
ncbi:MAG: Ig-like domain repeat protein, partial [Bryobacteraceae bacterium]